MKSENVREAEVLRRKALASSANALRHVIVLTKPAHGRDQILHPRADWDVMYPGLHHPKVVFIAPEVLHEHH